MQWRKSRIIIKTPLHLHKSLFKTILEFCRFLIINCFRHQQKGATCYKRRHKILKKTFEERKIFSYTSLNWPPKLCDFSDFDYCLSKCTHHGHLLYSILRCNLTICDAHIPEIKILGNGYYSDFYLFYFNWFKSGYVQVKETTGLSIWSFQLFSCHTY